MAMVPGREGNRWTDMGAGSDDEGDGKGGGVGIEGWCVRDEGNGLRANEREREREREREGDEKCGLGRPFSGLSPSSLSVSPSSSPFLPFTVSLALCIQTTSILYWICERIEFSSRKEEA